MNLNSLLCILNDGPHCAGEGVLAFICKTTKEATPFRLVCKELTRAIACFPWKCDTKIKHSFSSWHACFPNTYHCSISSVYVSRANMYFLKNVSEFTLSCSLDYFTSGFFPFLNRVRCLKLWDTEISNNQELDAMKRIAKCCVLLKKLTIYECTDAMLVVLQQIPNLTEIWFADYKEEDESDDSDDSDGDADESDGDTDETDGDADESDGDAYETDGEDDESDGDDGEYEQLSFSAEGLAQFGRAKKILKITATILTDEVCVAIADNFPALVDFSVVSVNKDLSENSLVRIVEKCLHLTHVWFALSIVTDALLVALSQHPTIQKVIIRDTRLTDKGVFALLECNTLIRFQCEEKRCELSATCKEAVLKRFPLCFI
jgi:hypothetical protein